VVEPTIVPRSEHAISRRDIDPDALKVLYRLHEHNYIAYLVGGSVRDLLLDRHPKDFDIGTSAHPHQVKKLFRNCWIIGRRFRLAHVKFGAKTIEVATFRRQVSADTSPEIELAQAGPADVIPPGEPVPLEEGERRARRRVEDHLIQRDNSYGTPEEDAFRRDFTVNALFYDIGTFSIIDYVGGLQDLDAGSSAASAIQRSASWRIRSACCAPSCSPHGSSSRSTPPCSTPSPRTATRSRAARRRGSSRSTTRSSGRDMPSRRSGSSARPGC
jgi:poly(A) polymerase